jgi:hypothetical protein
MRPLHSHLTALLLLCTTADITAGQSIFGRYSMPNPQGGKLILTIEPAAGAKVKGSLVANGNTFQLIGELDEGDLTGTLRSDAGTAHIEAAREGARLTVILLDLGPNGQPNMASARQLAFTVDDSPAEPAVAAAPQGAATPSAPAAAQPAAGPQDQELTHLFLSTAWCTFSYAGARTYSGGVGGRTTSARVAFSPDGLMQQTSNSERSNVDAQGNVWSTNSGRQTYRWRVQKGALMLSPDGVQWETVRIEVTQNSNGSPIVKADGVEYYRCQ